MSNRRWWLPLIPPMVTKMDSKVTTKGVVTIVMGCLWYIRCMGAADGFKLKSMNLSTFSVNYGYYHLLRICPDLVRLGCVVKVQDTPWTQ
jgi:hypothetical protein